jgi:hypothetical protein
MHRLPPLPIAPGAGVRGLRPDGSVEYLSLVNVCVSCVVGASGRTCNRTAQTYAQPEVPLTECDYWVPLDADSGPFVVTINGAPVARAQGSQPHPPGHWARFPVPGPVGPGSTGTGALECVLTYESSAYPGGPGNSDCLFLVVATTVLASEYCADVCPLLGDDGSVSECDGRCRGMFRGVRAGGGGAGTGSAPTKCKRGVHKGPVGGVEVEVTYQTEAKPWDVECVGPHRAEDVRTEVAFLGAEPHGGGLRVSVATNVGGLLHVKSRHSAKGGLGQGHRTGGNGGSGSGSGRSVHTARGLGAGAGADRSRSGGGWRG